MAPQSLNHSKSVLAISRAICPKLSAPKAVTTAHKLTRIIFFHRVTTRWVFDDTSFADDQLVFADRQEYELRLNGKPDGFQLMPM